MDCVWCGKELPAKEKYIATDHFHLSREQLHFYRCAGCGSDTLGALAAEETGKVYDQDYMFRFAGRESLTARIMQHLEWRFFYRPAYSADVKWLKNACGGSGKRFLEVGFGSGLKLKLMADAGFNAEGIEFSPACVRYAREELGCSVRKAALEDLIRGGEKFDVVAAYAVLEHIRDPKKFLGDMAKLLDPGGLLLIRTPVNDSWQLRFFGGRHSLYREAPRHVWIPSIRAMSDNLGRLGLKLMRRKGEPVIWGAGNVGCTMMPGATYFSSRRNGVTKIFYRILGGVFTVMPGLAFAVADALASRGAQTDFLYVKTAGSGEGSGRS